MHVLNEHTPHSSPYQFRTAVLGARKTDMGPLAADPEPDNIGDAIARVLLHKGHRVGVDDCYRSGAELQRDLHREGWAGGPPPPSGYYPPMVRDLGNWDHLVITLGHGVPADFRTAEEEVIEDVITATLTLPLTCARRYVAARRKHLPNGRPSRILFIGSYGHDHVLSNSAPYCAAKAGLAHAVRCLGWDLRPEFEVMILHPYHVPSTPLGAEVVEAIMRDKKLDRAGAEAYQRKDLAEGQEHLTPREIAEYVAWMLRAPESTWVNGQGINLYGGVR